MNIHLPSVLYRLQRVTAWVFDALQCGPAQRMRDRTVVFSESGVVYLSKYNGCFECLSRIIDVYSLLILCGLRCLHCDASRARLYGELETDLCICFNLGPLCY